MSPDDLRLIGAALFGRSWQVAVAELTGRAPGTVANWAAGRHPIPDAVPALLLAAVPARLADIEAAGLALAAITSPPA